MHSHPQFGVVPVLFWMTRAPPGQWVVEAGFLCSIQSRFTPLVPTESAANEVPFPLAERVTAVRGCLLQMLFLGCCGEFLLLLSKVFCELWASWVSSDVPFHTCLFLVSYHLQIMLQSITSKCLHCDLGMVGYHQKVWAHCLTFFISDGGVLPPN